MHKIEELYLRNDFDTENELHLFEPECIITDNPLNIKDENCVFFKGDNNFGENALQNISFDEQNINLNFTKYPDSKDYNSGSTNTVFDTSQNYNVADYCEPSLATSEQMVDLEHIQMHSIFTPEKRNKPKEVFTKCHNCEKFVIIRMCPETGDYSNCKYCFNSPFSNVPNTVDIVADISEKIPKPVMKPRKESPVVNSRSEASFKCDYCGKLFTRNWYLKQHIKLHSNQKPFACNHCDKRFLNSSNLKQHLKTHSVEYRCCLCDKTYINIESLKLHAQKHTTDPGKRNESANSDSDSKLISCSYCSEQFTSYNELKEHASTHTKDMPFQCDKCDKGFRYNGALLKHKKIHESESSSSDVKEKLDTVQ